jgi:sugar (pentulose or hexulose) kinase
MRSFLLAIDAGSSSVRCTAYEYHHHHCKNALPPPPLVTAVKGIGHVIPLEAIVPNTGHIRINEVLIAIDITIDETLRLLRQRMLLSCDKNIMTHSCPYQVVAIGFSTFVMNFVALDIHGDPVGNVATCSYACNRDDVVKECHRLQE